MAIIFEKMVFTFLWGYYVPMGTTVYEPSPDAGVAPGIFPRGGLNGRTRGLECGFQGTINAKNLRKNRISPSDGGLACSDGGYSS